MYSPFNIMYYWTPQKLKELKSRGHKLVYEDYKKKSNNRLTNSKNYDKGIDNEKIQSKNSRTRNRSSSNNTIRQRARHRAGTK